MNQDQLDKVTTTIEWIGPEQASAFLAGNHDNRKFKPHIAQRYADAMSRGEWPFNGESIKIAWDGTVLDGQHRLGGVVLSGVPIQTLVVRGLPPEAKLTVDIGVKRTIAEFLQMKGVPSSTQMGAAGALAYRYDNGLIPRITGRGATHTEALQYIEDNQELLGMGTAIASTTRRVLPLNSTVAATAFFIFARLSEPEALIFFDSLKTGADLPDGHPILTLRQRLLREVQQSRKLGTEGVLALVIKAWNAWRQDKSIYQLRWKSLDEPFPKAA